MTEKPEANQTVTTEAAPANPNVGPDPVEAQPNHVREKSYKAPNAPQAYEEERDALPENTAEGKVERDLPAAVDRIKRKL